MVDDPKKYLQDLGFPPGTNPTVAELKTRWKKLGAKFHPDNQDSGNEDEFKRVTHAYKMLTDPEYRQREVIDEIRRGNRNMAGDLNIRLQVPVSFEDAFFGRKIVISYNRLHLDDEMKPQPMEQLDVVTHTVKLPCGNMQGFEAMIEGGGHKCKDQYGHALAVFMVLPHKKFRVEGHDVISDESFPLEMLLKGDKVDVQTMYGVKTMKIPPGTKPGDMIKIRRCGVAAQGSHLVKVDMVYPTKDELKAGAWKGLGIDWTAPEEASDPVEENFMSTFARLYGNHIVIVEETPHTRAQRGQR